MHSNGRTINIVLIFFWDCADGSRNHQQGIDDTYKLYSPFRQILFLAIFLFLLSTFKQYIFVIV